MGKLTAQAHTWCVSTRKRLSGQHKFLDSFPFLWPGRLDATRDYTHVSQNPLFFFSFGLALSQKRQEIKELTGPVQKEKENRILWNHNVGRSITKWSAFGRYAHHIVIHFSIHFPMPRPWRQSTTHSGTRCVGLGMKMKWKSTGRRNLWDDAANLIRK